MASRGTTCPFCEKYSSVRKNGLLYVHKGNTRSLVGDIRLRCHASGMTYEQAEELKKRVDGGEKLIFVRSELLGRNNG